MNKNTKRNMAAAHAAFVKAGRQGAVTVGKQTVGQYVPTKPGRKPKVYPKSALSR